MRGKKKKNEGKCVELSSQNRDWGFPLGNPPIPSLKIVYSLSETI